MVANGGEHGIQRGRLVLNPNELIFEIPHAVVDGEVDVPLVGIGHFHTHTPKDALLIEVDVKLVAQADTSCHILAVHLDTQLATAALHLKAL